MQFTAVFSSLNIGLTIGVGAQFYIYQYVPGILYTCCFANYDTLYIICCICCTFSFVFLS